VTQTKELARSKHRHSHKEGISHSEKTPTFVNVAEEALKLKTREERLRLFTYQNEALVKELNRVPFHSAAYEIELRENLSKNEETPYVLVDKTYAQADILEWCNKAVAAAKNSQFARRYELEKKQIEHLLEVLGETLQPHVAFKYLSELTMNAEERNELLDQLGRRSITGLISDTVAKHYNINKDTECWAGPKFFSIMPQSEAHGNEDIMYAIDQPVFLPEHNLWLNLHDQHMFHITDKDHNYWQDQHRALQGINPDYVPPSSEASLAVHEEQIMAQYPQLPEEYLALSAEETFLAILYKNHEDQRQVLVEYQQKLAVFNRLKKTFPLHSNYIVDVLEIDEQYEKEWSVEKAERIYQALFNSISTFMHSEVLTPKIAEQWLTQYKHAFSTVEHRTNPWKIRDINRAGFSEGAGWIAQAVSSNIECFGVTITQLNPEVLQSIMSGGGTLEQLASVIGMERAKLWWEKGIQKCRTCDSKTHVGECGLCLNCEMGANKDPSLFDSIYKKSSHQDIRNNSQEIWSANSDKKGKLPNSSITGTQWLAGDF
jgi:hypothetical protein